MAEVEALSTSDAKLGKVCGSVYPHKNDIEPVLAADTNAIPAAIPVR